MRQTIAQTLKLSMFIILLFTAFLVLAACTKPYKLTTRLDTFYTLLDESSKKNFEEGNLEAVSKHLSEKLKDSEIRDQLDTLKEQEAIILFSTDQTIEYFYKYFYLKNLEKSS